MPVARKTALDRYSRYREIVRSLFDLFGEAKQQRTMCDGLGLTRPSNHPNGTGIGGAMGDITFPLDGELSHIDSASDLPEVVKSLEALETALATTIVVDGKTVLPIAVLAKFAG